MQGLSAAFYFRIFNKKKLRSVTAMAKNKKHLNGAGKFKKVNSKGPNGKKRKVNRIF